MPIGRAKSHQIVHAWCISCMALCSSLVVLAGAPDPRKHDVAIEDVEGIAVVQAWRQRQRLRLLEASLQSSTCL